MNESDNRAKIKFRTRYLSGGGKRRSVLILPVLLFGLLLLYFAARYEQKTADEPDNWTTDTRSTEFEDRDEKSAFLSRYLDMPSEVSEAAYHVKYWDNSGGRIPGPSDFDIRAAFSVKESDTSLWTAGMKKILPQQVDPDWWEGLKTPEFTWEIPSNAEYYVRPGTQSYVVVCPDISVILKLVSTDLIPLTLKEESLEELSGYDQFKAAAADELGYDHSTVPYIKTMLAEQMNLSDGTELTLICYRALFCNSPLYGIPVLVVSGGKNTFSTVLCDGSYWDNWHLADIDGDGQDELLMQHLIGITGGAGAYETDVYRLSDSGMTKLFGSPDQEDDSCFDTIFSLHLSEGFTHTVQNNYTGFHTSFTREASKETPYFDAEGNLTDDGRENNETDWLNADPYFYLFQPIDVEGDGIYEIMTAQYTYLYGRADGLGAAYTLLKWDSGMERVYIGKAGFWPYEDYEENDPEYQDYLERWEQYEDSWYTTEECGPSDSLDSKALIEASCERIREIDFQVRQYPVAESFYGSETDRAYRKAFYEAVTNQRPVLVRAYRSLDYEEVSYRDRLRSVYASDEEFIQQELKQSAGYYYTDYDGDGWPELIVRDTGLYGLKYDPEQDEVYLFLETNSSYSYFMGDGQIYWYNPCLAGKEIFSYEAEDRNGNQVYAGFETVSDWNEDTEDWDEYYYISVDGFYHVEVKEALWKELLGRLKEAYSKTPAPVTFGEFFDGFYPRGGGETGGHAEMSIW